MESIPRKPLRTASHCSLALLGLTCLLGTADARPVLPSERFPGPWLEVTQEIRDILDLNKVSACSQAAGRESSLNPGEYLLYCTSDEKLWTSWRVQPAARTVRGPAGCSRISRCRTDIRAGAARRTWTHQPKGLPKGECQKGWLRERT